MSKCSYRFEIGQAPRQPVPVKFLSDRTILNTNLETLRDLMIKRLIRLVSLIARFMEPTWGPSGADRTTDNVTEISAPSSYKVWFGFCGY